ncbi:MAG: acyltransferase [Oligoflexia bacterium]|nr:acyltransferase [Oligoflexia bacterium]
MRHIHGLPVFIFSMIVTAVGGFAFLLTSGLGALLPAFELRGILLLATFITAFYAALVTAYRLFLAFFPLPVGEIAIGSKEERIFMTYILFWLIFFHPIVTPLWVPVPFTRLLYKALGAQVGPKSYFGGPVLDAHFVTVGTGTLVGARALIVPHAQEGLKLGHYPVYLGDRVTIGAGAIILPGVTVGNDSIVGALSVVAKGTRIGEGEIWTGNPARFLRKRTPEEMGHRIAERAPSKAPKENDRFGASEPGLYS